MRNLLSILFLLILLPFLGWAQTLRPGTGSFNFTAYPGGRTKAVKVYYYIPTGDPVEMPVLFAFHGEERDGKGAMQDWIPAADANRFMVFAPEFSDALFPGGDGYNLGNMFVDGDNPTPATLRPDSLWTFSAIEPLFTYIKKATNARARGYQAFGHSAGSQFIHRFLFYVPQNRVLLGICANAGWYTMPDVQVTFPYGAGQSPWTSANAKAAFAKPILVFLGTNDISETSGALRHNTIVDRQGLNRLTRGRYFYRHSDSLARVAGMPFAWSLAEVPGVSHDHTLMAKNAAPFVAAAFQTADTGWLPRPLAYYSGGGFWIKGLQGREKATITACSLTGAGLACATLTETGNGFHPVSERNPGLYVAHVSISGRAPFTLKFLVEP